MKWYQNLMEIKASTLTDLIENELKGISNEQVVRHVRGLLVQPKPIPMNWDYGEAGQQYVCWIVLEEADAKVGIAYCDEGFGPKSPWGLVFLKENSSMGMDSAWLSTFMEAYIESAATEVPIWCVVKEDANRQRELIKSEGGWDETWAHVMALRDADPEARYHADTRILE